jgi:hypothetical protein
MTTARSPQGRSGCRGGSWRGGYTAVGAGVGVGRGGGGYVAVGVGAGVRVGLTMVPVASTNPALLRAMFRLNDVGGPFHTPLLPDPRAETGRTVSDRTIVYCAVDRSGEPIRGQVSPGDGGWSDTEGQYTPSPIRLIEAQRHDH